MKQRDVFWLSFPYSSYAAEKHRPALIVSNNAYNRSSDDVVVCALTSNLSQKPYSLLVDEASIVEGTLPIKSLVRSDKLSSVEKKVIDRKMCAVSEAFFKKVLAQISALVENGKA